MAIRVSGMVSGLDTDSIVQELVSAYSTKKDKYVKAQTKLEWKMDSWKSMNSKIYGFYTSSLSSMRLSGSYNLKTSTISDSSAAKVTASSSAVNGTQKLKVKQLASSGYLTGAKLDNVNGSNVTGNTSLKSMGIEEGSKIEVNDTEIEVTSDMTVNKLISKFRDAGVNVNFDESNQRFFVNSTKSGAAGEFTITANNQEGLTAIKKLGLFSTKDVDGTNETSDIAKYREIAADDTTADTERGKIARAIVNALAGNTSSDADDTTIADYEAAKSTVDTYESNQKLIASYSTRAEIEALRKPENTDVDNEQIDKMLKAFDYVNGHSVPTDQTSDEYTTYSEKLALIQNPDTGNEYTREELEALNDEEKLEAYNYIHGYGDEYTTAAKYVEENQTKYDTAVANKAAKEVSDIINSGDTNNQPARINGQDAIIELNGVEFTSDSGTFSINGLSITATQVTTDDVTITTATDTQAIYDKIKDFLGKYNELITAMDTAYNAESAGDYEPLTDDEKEEMSDKEIEKWETKIKDSLLRRDSTLGGASSSMKSIMNKSFEINGTSYSLASFGIGTLNYFTADTNEKGCLHIDGDSDDTNTAGNTDKLMAAINEDPEAVTTFFQKLSTSLYDDLTKRMGSTSVSSIYTLYNDKQMSSEYSSYKSMVSKWEQKVSDYEDFYYKKFSSMETALSKLQSSTSSLSSLLGSN